VHQVREKVATKATRAKHKAIGVAYLGGVVLMWTALAISVLVLISYGVNGIARWNARRAAEAASSPAAMVEKAKDNILLIGIDENERATGFLALKVDGEKKQIYGIALPDGAFIEVPGQGFERVGDSYVAGPEVSLSAITNFFSVPFTRFAVIDAEIYQASLTNQSMVGALDGAHETNLTDEELERFTQAFAAIPTGNVALIPLPVKPLNVGDQTYLEPQRAEIADLLETWWGVSLSDVEDVVRVIIYNGAGVPGIAGEAAQELIRSGYRVVDTKNADSFDYATTKVIVQNGPVENADGILKVLGTGEVLEQPADQQVADIIVIIGKDYKPASDTGD
jgi:hypothetical protein